MADECVVVPCNNMQRVEDCHMVIGHLLFWRMMGRIEERQRAAALQAMIRASAPGRAGIVGNPTDGYGGTVLSTSLAERATVRITRGDGIHLDVCGDQEAIGGVDDLELADRPPIWPRRC